MRFSEVVDQLYEKKIKPLELDDFSWQLRKWIQRTYHAQEYMNVYSIDSAGYAVQADAQGAVRLYWEEMPEDFPATVVKEAEKRGWYLLVTHMPRRNEMVFFPNYTAKIRKEDLPRYMWRASPSKYRDFVKKKGFTPRKHYNRDLSSQKQGQDIPARVYLFWDSDSLFNQITSLPTGRGYSLSDYDIYRVELSKIPRGVNFYLDTEYGQQTGGNEAVWTFSHIPPQAIKYIGNAFDMHMYGEEEEYN